jgi:hypothetical protein
MFGIFFETIVYIIVGCVLLALILLNGFLLVCLFKGVRAEASWFPFRVFRDEPARNTKNDKEQKVEIKLALQFCKDKSVK